MLLIPVALPSVGVSLAGGLATHVLRGCKVEQLLDAFDLLGYELPGAFSLLGELCL